MMKMKKALFLIGLLLASCFPFAFAATDEGYGEANDNLGQFTDTFENDDNVSVAYQVINNETLDCMELNLTSGVTYGNYTNNVKITIERNRINQNLTKFPVLISISDSSGINDNNLTGIFDEIGNSYQKIAVTDDSLLIEYYVDVEKWSFSDREGDLWIGANVSSLENIVLYLHYDGDVANNTGYVDISGSVIAQNVWDSNFKMVQHMNQASTPILDSTDDNNDGNSGGNPTYQQDGQINGAIDFDGNDEFNVPADADLKPQVLTLEIWMETDNYTRSLDGGIAYGLVFGGPTTYAYKTDFHNGFASSAISDGATTYSISDVPINDNNWHYYGMTYNGSHLQAYKDGVEAGSSPMAVSITIDYTIVNNYFMIGARDGGAYGLVGMFDDIRFSVSARTPEFINASYFNGLDDLVYYGILSSAGGYDADGYFTTTDYLNYTTGQSLALMVNASIPANTDIQVQFSDDNATWGDWEGIPLDSNILSGGFESIDLRYLNYTDIFFMFNFSTTDCSVTPRLYQARLISTIGAGGVAPGPGGSGAIGYIMLILICSPIIVLIVWGKRR